MTRLFTVLIFVAGIRAQFNFHGLGTLFSTDDRYPAPLSSSYETSDDIRILRERVDRLEKLVLGLQKNVMKAWNTTESGSKYKLFEERKSWDDAESSCQSFGAHLAVIDNEQKNNYVKELLKDSPVSDYAWIGMKTKTTSQSTFSNFDSENPIDGCAVLDKQGIWSIRSCVQLRPFICQLIKTEA